MEAKDKNSASEELCKGCVFGVVRRGGRNNGFLRLHLCSAEEK
jgi:hypothetical protein